MTALDFNIIRGLADIISALNDTDDFVLVMNPIDDGKDEIIRFEVKCVSRHNGYSCSRIFFMEDILLEDDFEEYFGIRVAALIIKCLNHSI